MNISVNPEDIDSVESVLHYMDEFPRSGQNRAAAKLIRKLLSAVPLVAAVDKPTDPYNYRAILENVSQCYENGVLKKHHMGEVREILAFKNTVLAGQVAPQATVEPLTDERIETLWALYRALGVMYFARALLADQLAATPATSKAQSDRSPPEIMAVLRDSDDESVLMFSAKEMRTVMGLWNSERFMRETLQERLNARAVTSKSDTGEAIRNAELEEAAQVARQATDADLREMVKQFYTQTEKSALKSATPSTIKPDHINDAVEMVADIKPEPTGERFDFVAGQQAPLRKITGSVDRTTTHGDYIVTLDCGHTYFGAGHMQHYNGDTKRCKPCGRKIAAKLPEFNNGN